MVLCTILSNVLSRRIGANATAPIVFHNFYMEYNEELIIKEDDTMLKLTMTAMIIAASTVTTGFIGFGGLCTYDGNHTYKEQKEYARSGENPVCCVAIQENHKMQRNFIIVEIRYIFLQNNKMRK